MSGASLWAALDGAAGRARRAAGPLLRRARKIPGRLWLAPLEIAFILALAFFAARLIWIWLAPAPGQAQAAAVAFAAAVPAEAVRDYAALTRFDPFHRRSARPAASVPAVTDAPATTLDLSLQGTRVGQREGDATAIIRTGNGRQSLYGVGDEVMTGVVVRAVYPDRVMLARAGSLEFLYFDADAARRAQKRRLAAADPAASDRAGPVAQERGSGAVSAAEAEAFLKKVRLRPRLAGGRIDGVVIAADGPATILKQNGLIPGDVLLAVNDRPIDSVAGAKRLLEDLRGAASVTVLIERDGERLSRTITLGG